jgi:hypothetical protein
VAPAFYQKCVNYAELGIMSKSLPCSIVLGYDRSHRSERWRKSTERPISEAESYQGMRQSCSLFFLEPFR